MSKNDFNDFKLTRGEFAKRIGKTTNAVRLAMRRGQYSGEYRFDGNKFLFKDPDRPRGTIVKNPGHMTPPKKIYNRGNHHNANYPNDSFRKYNEAKMLRAVNERDPNFIKDYKEIKEEHKKKKAEERMRKADKIMQQNKHYGRMLYGMENKFWEDELKYKKQIKRSGSFYLTGKPYSEAKHIKSDPYDDGSVEIDLSRSRSSNDEPSFKNKIEEEIWRLKRKK